MNKVGEKTIYTNQESAWAAKIAYLDFTDDLLARYYTYSSNSEPTIGQICDFCVEQDIKLFDDDSDGSKSAFIAEASSLECGQWKIVAICDDNDKSGLYAVALETGEYSANNVEDGVILAVRGSEANDNQFLLDWILTDMNIVNSDITCQEQRLNQFIDEEFAPLVQAKGYQNVAGMGHSLGGYLCFEGLAHIAATNPFLYDLLMQGVSIDGPNPPDENISANQSAYDMIKDFCYHYQYSLVGCIFEDNCICNNDHRFSIKEASNWQYNPVDFGVSMGASYELLGPQAQFFIQYLFGCVSRHNLPSLCFTEDGDFDYTANDTYNCPPDLFEDGDISWYRINGLQTVFYIINNILFSLENNTDAGTVAEMVSKITQSSDESNLPQIMFGSLIETITEEYNFFVKSNVSDDIKVAIEDLSLDTQLLSEVMYDYFTFVLPAASNQVDMVISPNETINKWFDFLSDINEFGQSFVQHAKGDYYNVADDVLKMDCIETMNIIEGAAELSKELLVSSERIIQSTVLAGTQEIIASVTNWDSYNKYINAQIELSSNWQDNISEISSNIAQISTFDDDLEDSLNTYKIASLKFLTASVAAFANSNSATGISTNILSNISALRQDMTRATNQLLSKTKLVSLNTEQLFRNVAILIKQGIEDSFQYIYAWGELKISNAIVDLASDYYEYVNELNISGVVDNWTLIAKKHNGATDVVYKVSDGGYLYGTDALDVLNGSRGDDNIIGYKGDDVIYGHAGNDTIDGGDGNDSIYGGSGGDSITGKAGNDIIYGEYGNDVIYGGTGDDQLFGGDGNDAIYGESGNDNIEGGLGNDVIYAGGGNDSINGGMGEDSIYGDDGNDQINGGSGNDRLEGSAGSDKYFFNIGDGVDVIYDYEWNFGNIDKISFGSGIRSEDVRMERRGNDLYVLYSKNDYLVVQDSYRNNGGTGRYFVENVEFADGTVWDTEEIANRANKIMGTNGDDTLWGFGEAVGYHQGETFKTGAGNDIVYAGEGADTIYGESGNDQLYGENGNDTLIGGKGSDRLEGGSGSDKYVFNLGDGADVIYDYEWNFGNVDKISFESVISSEDVRMERRGNDLYVWYSKNDHLIVQDSYRNNGGTGRYFVENVEFADGTVWDTEEIANRANKILGSNGDDTLWGFGEAVGYHQSETFRTGAGNDIVYAGEGADTIYGESGNDQLFGENGNDILIGGSGNDRLEGNAGSDKYFFNIGDGVDVIYDYEWNLGNIDKISFGDNIAPDDVRMERRGNDLYVWYSKNDYLIVQDSYRNNGGTGRYFVENVEFADGTVWDTEEIANRANKIMGSNGDDTLWGFGEAVGYHQSETFRTGAGNDIVYAGEGADTIYGESGNDQLYGENGNDTLIGGKGSDRLEGGSGSDKYVFNLGDGTDVIYDYEWNFGNIDKISFGDNITPDDVRMERRGNDLYVWYSKNDHLVVQDSYRNNGGTGRYFVENVEFADGTVWDTEEIANRANKILGSNGDDTLWGFGEAVGYHQSETFRTGAGNDIVYAGEGADTIYGESGNDQLYGENGDDTLIGGSGNDRLEGSAGSDKYFFNIGDGVDVIYDYEWNFGNVDKISFGNGISSEDVRMERRGNDLYMWYSKNDHLVVQDSYRNNGGTGRYFVENVEFADGTVWDTEEIANRANKIMGSNGDDTLWGFGEAVGYHQGETFRTGSGNDIVYAGDGEDTIYGESGNDQLFGENGNDILIGGSGNDRLEGNAGSDKYFFNIGDGVDVIYDYEWNLGNIDKISFGDDIAPDDVRMERRGNDLYVWYSKNDYLIVQDSYRNNGGTGRYFVENVEFADGTVWDTEEIANRANKILGSNGDDTLWGFGEAVGYHQSETFRTGAGNDIVYAGEGADTIYGESGNDQLYGENGNDTLIGGSGNDRLEGSAGSDKYFFNIGDGVDVIYDYEWNFGNVDKISFESVISSEDVRMERRGNDLYVWYSKNDYLIVQDSYRNNGGTGRYFVENVEFADGTVWDTEEIANRANKIMGSNGDDTLWGFGEAVGYHQSETFRTGAGNDIVYAGEGADTIYGESGNDQLYGENGNDTLIGGSGNDRLEGSAGADKYFFNIGDGVDVIYDYEWNFGNIDKISFGDNITPDDVRMERRGNDLYVWYSKNDHLVVQDSYRNNGGTGRYFVENVEFADGTVWDTEEIANRANKILGSNGDDTLWGFGEAVGYHQSETFRTGAGNDIVYAGEGADTIYGESGNDQLYGENGNDTLIGGKGSDRLEGGSGSDKYVFNLGDGTDVIYDYEWNFGNIDKISFGDNITPDDVRMERRGNDLYVWYSKNDHLVVQDSYRNNGGTGRYFVENVEFADGTVWDTEEIANRANKIMGTNGDDTLWGFGEAVGYHQSEIFHTGSGNDVVYAGDGDDNLYGEDGNDSLYGENGDDTIVGGKGNDYLDGSNGADTYVFNLGDGIDIVYDYEYYRGSANDRILLGEGISVNDIHLSRNGNNLVVDYNLTDSITIKDAYLVRHTVGEYRVENMEFYDGTKAEIDYDNIALTITYQPESVEEAEEIEDTGETEEGPADVTPDEQDEVISDEQIIVEEHDYDVDAALAAIEEVFSPAVQNDSSNIMIDESSVSLAESIDIETDILTNLVIQEMSSKTEGNISEQFIQNQTDMGTDGLLWAE